MTQEALEQKVQDLAAEVEDLKRILLKLEAHVIQRDEADSQIFMQNESVLRSLTGEVLKIAEVMGNLKSYSR